MPVRAEDSRLVARCEEDGAQRVYERIRFQAAARHRRHCEVFNGVGDPA